MVKCLQTHGTSLTRSKTLALILSLALLLSTSACGGTTEWSAYQLAHSTAGDLAGELVYIGPDSELYDEYVTNIYGLDTVSVTDGAVLASEGASAREVAVFEFSSGDAAVSAGRALESYLQGRGRAFTGYMPEEADMVENAELVTRDKWCALIVLPDSQAAAERFDSCFDAPPPENVTPPAETPNAAHEPEPGVSAQDGWEYSEERIVRAYKTGSWAELGRRDREILETVDYILTVAAPDTLSEPERELAIHDYMVDNIRYDSDTLSVMPGYAPEPNNDNPYGALVNGRAICLGYATSFQLLMDLAGIECITVHGGTSDEEHAWNMVRLDGEWYCVDVTWDDPSGYSSVLPDEFTHQYFNVTSDVMRRTDHIWDASSVPEAAGTRWAWENIPH